MTRDVLVGLDVGTTNVKAAAIDPAGEEVVIGGAPTPWTPVPSGAECSVEQLVGVVMTVLADVLGRAGDARALGVGITGMAEAGALLDERGRATSPVIAWYDTRATSEVAELVARLGAERFTDRTYLAPSPVPTVAKLLWMRRRPEWVRPARRWLGVPELVAFLLGGAPVADLSLACRTGLLDVAARTWWDDAVSGLGDVPYRLAEVTPSGTALGTIGVGDAVPSNLHGATIAVAGHDHLTAAVGAGVTSDADVFDSCGTAEALVRCVDPLSPTEADAALTKGLSVSWHALPGRQALIGAADTGRALTGALKRLGCTDDAGRADLDRRAQRHDSAAPDETAEAWRSAVDGATAPIARLFTAITEIAGPVRSTVVTGGWARSDVVLDARRKHLGPVTRSAIGEAGARGAALAAGIAAGTFAGWERIPAGNNVEAR